jgi:NADH:ubiquinone oxidoreductase subunit B-like Fe-S oxidoreductase
MLGKRDSVGKQTAYPRDNGLAPSASVWIIQFGILCCAVAMVVVLTIAVLAG